MINEKLAIKTLYLLEIAQLRFATAICVDQDLDGSGEYGLIDELSGDRFLRGENDPIDPLNIHIP